MKNQSVKVMVFMALFGAIATVLMLFEFPIPFVPVFIKFDFSDMPIIIAGFMYGPLAAFGSASVKILLNLLLNGTDTMFIGELSNFVLTLIYALPASIIYLKVKNKKVAEKGLIVSILAVSICAVLSNLFIMFPLYGSLMGLSMDAIVGMASAVNPLVSNAMTMMIFAILPFNLFKYTVESLLVLVVYKRISHLLKRV